MLAVAFLVFPVVAERAQAAPETAAAVMAELVQAGISPEEADQLVRTMQAARFEEPQMKAASAVILAARQKGIPTGPIMNKAQEGLAKHMPAERTLLAMQAVGSRYESAYGLARSLAVGEAHPAHLGNVLAEAFAAGLAEPDAARIADRLREKSRQLRSEELNALATVSLTMARDMSRLGVTSSAASELVAGALARGFGAEEIAGMHQSMLTQSQTHSPQNLARSYIDAVHQGHLPHGAAGGGQGVPGHGAASGPQGGAGGGQGGGSGGGGSGGGPGGGGSGGGGSGAGGGGGSGAGGGPGGNR